MAWTIQKTPLSRIEYRPALALLMVHLLFALLSPDARCCTTFCLERGPALLFGKNYDWNVEDGMLVTNKRHVEKFAATQDRPARWTSRYGSVTFNQYGREFPNGGMNEQGLVVEIMWLDETEYPPADERPAVPNLQWVQYQLDTAARVDEVLASDAHLRITAGGSARIHFLVADATGAAAAIEFIGGRRVVHHGSSLPHRVLTNDTYAASAAYAASTPEGRAKDTPSSLDRFDRAAEQTMSRAAPAPARHTPDGSEADAGTPPPATATPADVDAAFALLKDVAQGRATRWSIVYDIHARRIHFRTQARPAVRFIDFTSLDFACATPVRILDLAAPHQGDATAHLQDYTEKANLDLVRAAFSKTEFLRNLSPDARLAHARMPGQMRCATPTGH